MENTLESDRSGYVCGKVFLIVLLSKIRMVGRGKGYPNSDQTFQAEFNELLFISIVLKLNQNFMDSLMVRSQGSNATSPPILGKVNKGKQVRLGLNFRGDETQFNCRSGR